MNPLRKTLIILGSGFLALLLETLVKFYLSAYAYLIPNLVLVVVVFLGFREVSFLGAVLAFILGGLYDLSSGTLLGPWCGAFVLIYGILCTLAQRVFADAYVAASIALFASSLVGNVTYLLLTIEVASAGQRPLLTELPLEAFMTALLGPLIFVPLRKLYRRRDRRLI